MRRMGPICKYGGGKQAVDPHRTHAWMDTLGKNWV